MSIYSDWVCVPVLPYIYIIPMFVLDVDGSKERLNTQVLRPLFFSSVHLPVPPDAATQTDTTNVEDHRASPSALPHCTKSLCQRQDAANTTHPAYTAVHHCTRWAPVVLAHFAPPSALAVNSIILRALLLYLLLVIVMWPSMYVHVRPGGQTAQNNPVLGTSQSISKVASIIVVPKTGLQQSYCRRRVNIFHTGRPGGSSG